MRTGLTWGSLGPSYRPSKSRPKGPTGSPKAEFFDLLLQILTVNPQLPSCCADVAAVLLQCACDGCSLKSLDELILGFCQRQAKEFAESRAGAVGHGGWNETQISLFHLLAGSHRRSAENRLLKFSDIPRPVVSQKSVYSG